MGDKITGECGNRTNKRNRGNTSSGQGTTPEQGKGAVPKSPGRTANPNVDTEPRIVEVVPKRGASNQANEEAGTSQEPAIASSQVEVPRARNSEARAVTAEEYIEHTIKFPDDSFISEAFRQRLMLSDKYSEFMHIICHFCKLIYSEENPPYIQKCGISLCGLCNIKKTKCSICCPEGTEIMSIVSKDLNRDLLCNASVICTINLEEQTQTEKVKDLLSKLYQSRGDDLRQRLESEFCKISKMQENLQTPIGRCLTENGCIASSRLLWENISSILNDLERAITSKGESLEIAQELWRTEEKLTERGDLDTFEGMWRTIDSLVFDALTIIIPKPNINIGIRTLDFDAYKLQVLGPTIDFRCIALRRDPPRDVWINGESERAVRNKKEKKKGHRITFYKKFFYVGNVEEDLNYSRQMNWLIVDYERLVIGHPLRGVFFVLEMVREKGLINIEVNFQPSLSRRLKKQIILLCSGEQGFTYKNCVGYISEHDVSIKCQVNDTDDIRNDIISKIPDDAAPYIVPTKGMVIATRVYGENESGIRIVITTQDDEELVAKQNLVGIVSNIDNLTNMSKGYFRVFNCGLIFNLNSEEDRYEMRER